MSHDRTELIREQVELVETLRSSAPAADGIDAERLAATARMLERKRAARCDRGSAPPLDPPPPREKLRHALARLRDRLFPA